MPVDIESDRRHPEEKRIEVVGTSSKFVIETWQTQNHHHRSARRVLRFLGQMRVAVAIRKASSFRRSASLLTAQEYPEGARSIAQFLACPLSRRRLVLHAEQLPVRRQRTARALSGDLEPRDEVWSRIRRQDLRHLGTADRAGERI